MSIPPLQPIRQALAEGLRRFPLVILTGLLGTAAMIVLNHSESETIEAFASRIAYSAVFSFPLLVAAVYAGELFRRQRRFFQIAALLAIWAHWQFLDPKKDALTFVLVWIAAAATVSAVPGLVANPKSNWWRANIGAINALILAKILTLVVLLGLMLAVESLNALFDLELKGLDGDVMAVCVFLVAPLAVVMLLPPARSELDVAEPGYAAWGRLCQWALVPIGFLFTAILAAYAVRILIEQQLPNGMVALPVLTLGCYGLAALWILKPWRNEKIWAKAFSRVFPVAFPLFSILLFLALARRIEDYGFTFDRYAALALAIWIVACCLVSLIGRTASPALAPALLAVFALVAAFGPLSSQEVCLRSQTRHLEKLLADRTPENDTRIASSLRYLAYHYDQSIVERFTGPLDLEKDPSKWEIAKAAIKKLGLSEMNPDSPFEVEFDWPEERPLSTEGYRLVHGIRCGPVPLGQTASGEKLEIWRRNGELAAYAGSKKLHAFDLSTIDPESAESAAAPPGFPWSFEGREFLVVILEAEWRKTSPSTRELTRADVIVFEK
jgi:hypothetical protein